MITCQVTQEMIDADTGETQKVCCVTKAIEKEVGPSYAVVVRLFRQARVGGPTGVVVIGGKVFELPRHVKESLDSLYFRHHPLPGPFEFTLDFTPDPTPEVSPR